MNWTSCNFILPPEGVEVNTKIDDQNGCRNEQKLVRKGNLWFTDTTLSIYVYYTPTHWSY